MLATASSNIKRRELAAAVARGGVYASLSPPWLAWFHPYQGQLTPSTNGAKGLLPLSLSGPRAKTKLTRKLISARTTSPYDSSEDNTPLSGSDDLKANTQLQSV